VARNKDRLLVLYAHKEHKAVLVQAVTAYSGSKGIEPLILNLDTSCRSEVNCYFHRGELSRYQKNMSLG